jgi:serine/threonine-protein kinase
MPDFVDLHPLGTWALLGLCLAALGGAWSWCLAGGGPERRPEVGPDVSRIGPYLLLNQLGAGSMGVVWRARHAGTGRLCAVKLLPRGAGERERRQFDNEVRHAARIEHPNTVRVYDEGTAADGTRFFAMELLDGVSLEQLVQREGPLPASRVIPILLQACAGLGAAHAQGLVHRDIKPSNIVLARGPHGDQIKLLDFGLVKHLGETPEPAGVDEPVVGTPLYISPEAIRSPQTVDARSDLYGLGAVAYFLLSGAPVFGGQTVIEVCSQHLLTPPEPLSKVVGWSLGADLEAAVLACLEKDPSARPASTEELARRLARCADAEDAALAAGSRFALGSPPMLQTSV